MAELLIGLSAVLEPGVLLGLLAGSVIGIVTGVLPGIGPAVGIAVLLPLTFGMSPLAGMALMLGIYCGGWFGGAVPAVLINTPGTPAAVVTTFDGYPMARRGEAQRAISIAFAASFCGGVFSVLVLIVAAPQLALLATKFGAPEYLMAALLALVLVIAAFPGRTIAATTATALGLFASTVGLDPNTLGQRYTFGVTGLLSGLPLVPVVIGIFGVAQALSLLETRPAEDHDDRAANAGIAWQALGEVFYYPKTLLKSSAIGTGIGALPGIGTVLATFFAYLEAKRASATPQSFGHGSPEGIVAAEASNNAVTGAAMIPVLALGIPGDALTALMMGVFIIHSIYPGPRLFIDDPALVYGIFVAMLVINVAIFALLLASSRWLHRITRVDPSLLGVAILCLCFVGSYSMTSDVFAVWVALGAGVFGYAGRRVGLPMVGFLLGLILGPMIEARLRQSLSLSDGSPLIFLERPIAAVLAAAVIVAAIWPVIRALRRQRRRA